MSRHSPAAALAARLASFAICLLVVPALCGLVVVALAQSPAAPKRLPDAKPSDCAACHGKASPLPQGHTAVAGKTMSDCTGCHAKGSPMALRGRLPLAHTHQLSGVTCKSCHANLRKADDLFRAAGCKRDGGKLLLPDGTPFAIEFLDSSPAMQPHTEPFMANLRKLGVDAHARIVDTVQYKRRIDAFDFDMTVSNLSGSLTPGVELRSIYGSKAAATPGSRNLSGVADPVVDALLERVANAGSREKHKLAGLSGMAGNI